MFQLKLLVCTVAITSTIIDCNILPHDPFSCCCCDIIYRAETCFLDSRSHISTSSRPSRHRLFDDFDKPFSYFKLYYPSTVSHPYSATRKCKSKVIQVAASNARNNSNIMETKTTAPTHKQSREPY